MNSGFVFFRIAIVSAVSILASAGLISCSDDRPAPLKSGDVEASARAEQRQLWTCGMHNHVIENEAGPCPICGMDMTATSSGTRPKQAADGNDSKASATKEQRKIEYWVAPMDPTFITDAPGKSPMGMDLVPVYEDELPGHDASVVSIDPAVVQNMGVRIEYVKRQPLFRHLRTVGEIETAENLVSVVNLRFSGWIEKIHIDKTGEQIEEGETLFEIYSPDLVAAQEEYLLALRTQGPKASLTVSARRKLGLFNLDTREIRDIEQSGRSKRAVPIRAPRSGYVLHKNVVEGARVPAGQDLYTIADLSSVWVQAEIYAHDAPWVEAGQSVWMELSYQRGMQIEGTVAYIYPTLNEASRTLTVRLEFSNPDLRLKPGMFATVYIEFRRIDDAVVVPTEAVLHSGTRELVFVSTGEGHFEAREITTGLVGDRRLTQVLSGLLPGEQVVTSGQFLIDSESQLQEAIAKMLDPRERGADPEAGAAGPGSNELYACPMHPKQTSQGEGRCSICGMDLEIRSATSEEMASLHAREHRADTTEPDDASSDTHSDHGMTETAR